MAVLLPASAAHSPQPRHPAKAVCRKLVAEVERASDAEPEKAPFLGRTAEMAVRLATTRAAGIRPLASTITPGDTEWGKEIAPWSANSMMAGAGNHMAETKRRIVGSSERTMVV